jgi:hypothetical protein
MTRARPLWAVAALRYLISKAEIYRRDFAALRFSYGLNGILLKRCGSPYP